MGMNLCHSTQGEGKKISVRKIIVLVCHNKSVPLGHRLLILGQGFYNQWVRSKRYLWILIEIVQHPLRRGRIKIKLRNIILLIIDLMMMSWPKHMKTVKVVTQIMLVNILQVKLVLEVVMVIQINYLEYLWVLDKR